MLMTVSQEEEGQAGDQDQEEKRWNKRTQQMLHGLQVECSICLEADLLMMLYFIAHTGAKERI